MKNKHEVEIIKPFIEGQKKGEINYMKKKDAIYCEKEGLVKILNKTIKQKKEKKNYIYFN